MTIGISLSLALGIGANSAVFSLVDAVLFKPLNVGNPARLVSVYTSDYSGSQYGASSHADFIDFRNKADVFESLAVFTEISTPLRSENQSERAYGLLVSANYFDLLGVRASQGRTFQAEEDQTSGTLVVSHSFWQRAFAGDRALVGKTVLLNNNSFTVIGIIVGISTGAGGSFFCSELLRKPANARNRYPACPRRAARGHTWDDIEGSAFHRSCWRSCRLVYGSCLRTTTRVAHVCEQPHRHVGLYCRCAYADRDCDVGVFMPAYKATKVDPSDALRHE